MSGILPGEMAARPEAERNRLEWDADSDRYRDAADLAWARRWPMEEIWRARKPA
jgi:hypothetical protein